MKIRIVDKYLGLSGNNIFFEKEDFFGLRPNESVVQIGNGKDNGTIRTDKFSYPVKYVGSIFCQFDKTEKMFAFLLPEKVNGENVYLLYGKTANEIFTEAVYSTKNRETGKTTGYIRFYAPQFIRTTNII